MTLDPLETLFYFCLGTHLWIYFFKIVPFLQSHKGFSYIEALMPIYYVKSITRYRDLCKKNNLSTFWYHAIQANTIAIGLSFLAS
jgi:hypothetical protein